MSADRTLTEIYHRQAERAGRAAVVVVGGGGLGTLVTAGALLNDTAAARDGHPVLAFAVLTVGSVLTAVCYAVVSALQTHAEAAAARHRGAATADTA